MKPKLIAVLFVVLTSCSSLSPQTREMVGRPAPFVRLTMLDGDYVPLNAFRGKKVMLLFWASWCRYSRRAIHKFNQAAGEAGRGNAKFIAVSVDKHSDYEPVLKFIEEHDLRAVEHAFSGNDFRDEAYLAFHLTTAPVFVVIDENGKVLDAGHSIAVIRRHIEH